MISCFFAVTLFSNGLLKNSTNGKPIATGKIDHFKIINNGNDVALVLANNISGSIFIVDLKDNNKSEQKANLVSEVTNYITKIEGALGVTGITIDNIEINPISRSVYILASKTGTSYLLKATNSGKDLSLVDLSSVDYSSLKFSNGGLFIQDITYGSDKLYVSSGQLFSGLKGEVAVATAPFEHSTSMTNRASSMYKTNWGGGFKTNAPIEKWDYATIGGNEKLIGVTVCAPGFSFDPSTIVGTGVFQVDEQFNLVNNVPEKVIHAFQDGKHYLYNLHNENGSAKRRMLMRVGEHYIDGTPKKNNKHNANVKRLRTFAGAVANGLTDADLKIYTTEYHMIAKYDDHNLLVLTSDDKLTMVKVGSKDPEFDPVSSIGPLSGNVEVHVFPNPVSSHFMIELANSSNSQLNYSYRIYNLKGELVQQNQITNMENEKVDISGFTSGNYQLIIEGNNSVIYNKTLYKN